MKELSIEEKAKAYDEAIRKLRGMMPNWERLSYNGKTFLQDLIYIFPELKESEGERIRKEIIDYLKQRLNMTPSIPAAFDSWIAWLEKQEGCGQEKYYDTCDSSMMDNKKSPYGEKRDFGYFEEKPADKVEPRFKSGDWIVTDNNHIWLIDEDCSTTGYSYRLISQNGKVEVGDYNIVDEHARLWTLTDAKPGDVLAFDDDTIVLFKDLYNSSTFHSYCHIEDGLFNISKDEMPDWWEGKEFHPATKKQRDILFQKMKESGYEWDADKKELNEIHVIDEGKAEMDYCFTKMMNGEKVTPAWGEEDEKNISTIRIALRDAKLDAPEEFESYGRETTVKDFENAESWLKSIKPQPKHEFGEEDEKMVGNIRSIIEKYAISQSAVDVNGDLCEKTYIDADNWLKSLKQRLIG